MQKTFTILFLSLLLLSCSDSERSDVEIIQITAVSGQEYTLSEMVTEREFFPVTRDGSGLFPVQVERILSTGEHLVLLDRQVADAAFIYNTETHQLELLGGKGSGPGEYTGADDIYFDSETNRLYLLDGNQGKLIRFSADDFSVADERQIGFSATRFSAGPDHFYFRAGANPEKIVTVTDRNLEVTGRFIDNDIRHHFNPVNSFYTTANGVVYYTRYSNRLYSFKSGEINEGREILFENDNFREQDFASAPDFDGDYESFTDYADQYRSNFFAIEETPGLVYIFYSFQGQPHIAFYDKESGNSLNIGAENVLNDVTFDPLLKVMGQDKDGRFLSFTAMREISPEFAEEPAKWMDTDGVNAYITRFKLEL